MITPATTTVLDFRVLWSGDDWTRQHPNGRRFTSRERALEFVRHLERRDGVHSVRLQARPCGPWEDAEPCSDGTQGPSRGRQERADPAPGEGRRGSFRAEGDRRLPHPDESEKTGLADPRPGCPGGLNE